MRLLLAIWLVVLLTGAAVGKKKPVNPDEAGRKEFAKTYELDLVRAGHIHGILTENVEVSSCGNKHDGNVLCITLANGVQTVGRTFLLNFYERDMRPNSEKFKSVGFTRVRVIYDTGDRGVDSIDFMLQDTAREPGPPRFSGQKENAEVKK